MKKKPAVTHRAKHDSGRRRNAGQLAEHPAMIELSRMVEAGEIDRERTLAYLRKGRKTRAMPSRD